MAQFGTAVRCAETRARPRPADQNLATVARLVHSQTRELSRHEQSTPQPHPAMPGCPTRRLRNRMDDNAFSVARTYRRSTRVRHNDEPPPGLQVAARER